MKYSTYSMMFGMVGLFAIIKIGGCLLVDRSDQVTIELSSTSASSISGNAQGGTGGMSAGAGGGAGAGGVGGTAPTDPCEGCKIGGGGCIPGMTPCGDQGEKRCDSHGRCQPTHCSNAMHDMGIESKTDCGMECLKCDGEGCSEPSGSECNSSYCADGVCCNTACTAQCEQCNLLDKPGQCSPTPLGVDDHSELGNCEGDCFKTCRGDKKQCSIDNHKQLGASCKATCECIFIPNHDNTNLSDTKCFNDQGSEIGNGNTCSDPGNGCMPASSSGICALATGSKCQLDSQCLTKLCSDIDFSESGIDFRCQ